MKVAFAWIGGVVLFFAGIFALAYFNLNMARFFNPAYEQVRHNTFKESQAYNDGMLRDLQNLQLEYMKANDEQKAAMKAIVLHRFSVYDVTRLPPDLRSFYETLRRS